MYLDRILDALEQQTGLIRGRLMEDGHRDILGALLSRAGYTDKEISALPPVTFPKIQYGWTPTYERVSLARNDLMNDYGLDHDDLYDLKKFNDSLEEFTPEGRLEVMKFVIATGWW